MPAKEWKKDADGFTPMQVAFCYEYIANKFHLTKAALAAGCTEKSAAAQGSKWLKDPKIKKRIAELTEKHLKTLGASSEQVIRRLAAIGFSSPKDYIKTNGDEMTFRRLQDMTDEEAAAIREIDLSKKRVQKIKLADPGKHLELIGKTLGMFPREVKLSGNIGVGINVELSDTELNDRIIKLWERMAQHVHGGDPKPLGTRGGDRKKSIGQRVSFTGSRTREQVQGASVSKQRRNRDGIDGKAEGHDGRSRGADTRTKEKRSRQRPTAAGEFCIGCKYLPERKKAKHCKAGRKLFPNKKRCGHRT